MISRLKGIKEETNAKQTKEENIFHNQQQIWPTTKKHWHHWRTLIVQEGAWKQPETDQLLHSTPLTQNGPWRSYQPLGWSSLIPLPRETLAEGPTGEW